MAAVLSPAAAGIKVTSCSVLKVEISHPRRQRERKAAELLGAGGAGQPRAHLLSRTLNVCSLLSRGHWVEVGFANSCSQHPWGGFCRQLPWLRLLELGLTGR